MKKIMIGISSCLIGENVRYDGGNKRDTYLADKLSSYVKWVPVCPEVECGLPVPREPMRLEGDPDSPKIISIVTNTDKTELILAWISKRLERFEKEEISAFIFKSRSPSCALDDAEIFLSDGNTSKTGGIYSKAFVKQFPSIPVIDDSNLKDDHIRGNFIKRVLGDDIWQQICVGSKFR